MPAKRHFRPHHAPHSGYVLLVVLAVSVLVLTVLGTLANLSLQRGLQAADAQRGLQMRWGALTLQEAMLRQADNAFTIREERIAATQPGAAPPPATIRTVITLGGVRFDLLLGDEDAKLNLNALYHHAGQQKAGQALSRSNPALGRAIRSAPAVKPLLLSRESRLISPASEDSEDQPIILAAFRSWGEVFDLGQLDRLGGGPAALANVTTTTTCWGSGQLNFRRASDDAILAVLGSVVQDGGAQRILKKYRRNPTVADLNTLLETEVSNRSDRRELARLLSETSANFSLWIHASARSGQPLQRFVVMNRDDEGVTRYEQFAF